MVHPDYVLPPGEAATIPEREPVYPLSEGLTNHRLGDLAGQALARRARRSPNGSSRACKAQQGWPDWAEALDDRASRSRRGARRASGSLMTRCSPTSSP